MIVEPHTVLRGVYSLFCRQNTELQSTVEALEKERDFYFSKLRDIELICQDLDRDDDGAFSVKELSEKVTEILYATEVS